MLLAALRGPDVFYPGKGFPVVFSIDILDDLQSRCQVTLISLSLIKL